MDPRGGNPVGGNYRFVHTSDLHLDAPVRGVGLVPEAVRAALRDASLKAWNALVELAVEHEAAFVVVSGGLFNGDVATLRSCVALRDGLQRLRAHAIDTFIALSADDAPVAPFLSTLRCSGTFFGAGQRSTVRVLRGGTCLATLHGTSGDAAAARQLVETVRPSGAGLQIGVLPAAPDEGPGTNAGAQRLARAGLDYWALGGAPSSAVLQERPWMVFPGTPQGRGLDAAELGPKGCMVVEVEDGHVRGATLAELDRVRFAAVDIDVGECPDLPAMRQRVQRRLERDVASRSDRLAVVEVTLSGAMTTALRRQRLGVADELLAALRGGLATAGAPVWCAAVHDHTAGYERAASAPGDLRHIVSEQSEALRAPLPRSRFLAGTFAPLLQLGHAESDLDGQRVLVREAAALGLDLLGVEGSE